MKSEVLDNLYGARDQVSAVLIETVPIDSEERKLVQQLFQRYDRLSGMISLAIESAFVLRDFSAEINQLEHISGKLEQVARNITGVVAAIDLVDQAIAIATSLIKLAA
jgi:hypothetical protein